MAWVYILDTAAPDGATNPVSVIDNYMQNDKKAIQERLDGNDLYFPLTGTQVSDVSSGKHRKMTFALVLGAKPTLLASEFALYTKTVSGKSQLFFEDADGTEHQLTSGGFMLLDDRDVTARNNQYIKGKDAAGTGTVDLIKANASDIPVIPDGAQTATSAAPTEDAGIANKKYVDDTPHTGGIVQTVNTQTGLLGAGLVAQIPWDDTIPQIGEGTEVLSATITPKSATNKLKIDVVVYASENVGGNIIVSAALFQDAGANALAAAFSWNGVTYPEAPIVFTHYMDAGGVAATTFTVRVGPSGAATVTVNGWNGLRRFGGTMRTSITITELRV